MLVIGTSKAVVFWDGSNLETVLQGHGLYTGCTWSNDSIYIAERNHHGPEQCPKERIAVYDTGFHLKYTLCSGMAPNLILHDMHALYYDFERELLIVTNTGRNQILFWGKDAKAPNTDQPVSIIPWEALLSGTQADKSRRDINHLNSVWIAPDRGLWVVEHNRGDSRLIKLDQTLGMTRCIQMGREAHDVFEENGRHVWTCSSRHNALQCFDFEKNTVVRSIQLPGKCYPRGLAVGAKYFWVGMTPFNDKRGVRNSGPAKVIAVDRRSGRIATTIRLNDAGQIFFVRLTDGQDLAHNQSRLWRV